MGTRRHQTADAPDIRARKGGEPIVFRHRGFEPVHHHAERVPDQNEIAVAVEQTRARIEPVSSRFLTGLCLTNTDIGNCRAETRAQIRTTEPRVRKFAPQSPRDAALIAENVACFLTRAA